MSITLLHGSDHIIERPVLKLGKKTNDYGRGFYCTRIPEMAKEWACKNNTGGFANAYDLDDAGLNILNLMDGQHSILNWIALLLANRTFSIQNEIEQDAKDFLLQHYLIDLSEFDMIIGYRADDSYFSYAQSFISNTLPLRTLGKAMTLGNLGEQTALISEKAFDHLSFIDAQPVSKEIYYPKFNQRDTKARLAWKKDLKKSRTYLDDLFVLDILREEIQNDDPRIQRIISE